MDICSQISGFGTAPLAAANAAAGESLSYNGVNFATLYTSELSGNVVQDDAKRTTMYVEWTLKVDGVITLSDAAGDPTIDNVWQDIRKTLSAHAGQLVYKGKGFGDLIVNAAGSPIRDVAWGPVPKILSFQPLGGSRSAFIKWECITRIPEIVPNASLSTSRYGTASQNKPIVQYSYSYNLTYDQDGYPGFTLSGILEIPLTRTSVSSRQVTDIVDAYRKIWADISIDLTNYKVTRRSFNTSSDKRTLTWEYQAEALPPMGLPLYATKAGGSMSVRPLKSPNGKLVLGYMRWAVTLRCTYAITPIFPQRAAAEAFFALLWYRMSCSANQGVIPGNTPANGPQQEPGTGTFTPAQQGIIAGANVIGLGGVVAEIYRSKFNKAKPADKTALKAAWLMDFGFDEGLYDDSKQVSFNASWFICCNFRSLFEATGVWRWLGGTVGGNDWAQSMKAIMGWRSWLSAELAPDVDIIVDMGGGLPPGPQGGPLGGIRPPLGPAAPGR